MEQKKAKFGLINYLFKTFEIKYSVNFLKNPFIFAKKYI